MKRSILLVFIAVIGVCLCAQESIGSFESLLYNLAVLNGEAIRPYCNYQTFSDADWDGSDFLRIYGPELYTSYNSHKPFGQDDGVLWQGRGFNTSLSAGFRLEAYGFELTIKPDLTFSQNVAFDLIPPSSGSELFVEKAATYGYYGIGSPDAPQRFGNESFFDYSWGDTELRYSWKTLTVGLGTQAIWLGPAAFNPILFSNNAAPFPKFDVGIRKQTINLFGYNWGTIEGRSFWGQLTESNYFDTNEENDHLLLNGLSVSYIPPFAPGLTLGLHRTMLSAWEADDYTGMLLLLWPFSHFGAGKDERDQRASISLDYLVPSVGMELYLEWARNDYSPDLGFILRYPFHTQAYTMGIKKAISIFFSRSLKGMLFVELTNLESSRDYELIGWKTTFYAHHLMKQGYTNRGQWMGAGIGTGGNSQILGLDLFSDNSMYRFFIQRRNPDNDYVWFMQGGREREYKIRSDICAGFEGIHAITPWVRVGGGFTFIDSLNYYYLEEDRDKHFVNFQISTKIEIVL